jgi:hypothetical protein
MTVVKQEGIPVAEYAASLPEGYERDSFLAFMNYKPGTREGYSSRCGAEGVMTKYHVILLNLKRKDQITKEEYSDLIEDYFRDEKKLSFQDVEINNTIAETYKGKVLAIQEKYNYVW